MQFTLVLSVVLVVLVVLMFLRTIRATIIAGVALPLSLIATFGVMWFCGFSLDNLSLMALTIGTGFVVDDAIVMIENIVRHIEDGESPFEAALRGAREIGFTVISLTLSLIAVFIPLLFMTGLVGRMFREFALTLTIAVVVSAIVSLTLTPMMCSRILRHQAASAGNARRRASSTGAVDRTVERYRRSLEWVLRHQTLTLLVTLAHAGRHGLALHHHPEGLPAAAGHRPDLRGDRRPAPKSRSPQMQRLQAQVEAAIRKDPDVTGVVSVVGVSRMNPTPNAGRLAITLRPRDERARQRRPRSSSGCKQRGRADSRHHGLLPAGAGHPDQHPRRAARSTSTRWSAPTPSDVLEWARAAGRRSCGATPVLRDVASEAQEGGLRMHGRTSTARRAGRLGVSMQAVNDTLNNAFGQRQISTIYGQANQYRVILEAHAALPAAIPASLSQALCRRGTGGAAGAARSSTSRASSTPSAPLVDRAPGAVPVGDHQLQPRAAAPR